MDWVHCNSCFSLPSRDKKDIHFSLTSCGHIFCSNCQGKNFCSICKKQCSVVSLSKQLLNDVKVYFSNPVSLFEKLILELERVYMFQKTQRERLFQHKKEEIKRNSQKVMGEINLLEREVADLEKQLKLLNESSVTNPASVSGQNTGFTVGTNIVQKATPTVLAPKVSHPPPTSLPLNYNCVNPAVVGYSHPQQAQQVRSQCNRSQTDTIPSSIVQTNPQLQLQNQSQVLHPRFPSPNFQSRSNPCVQSNPNLQSSSQSRSSSQSHSSSQFNPGAQSTRSEPSSLKQRILMSAQQRNIITPPPSISTLRSTSPGISNAKRPRLNGSGTTPGLTRLCIRTPPIDGKMGVIPGSAEATLRSKVMSPGNTSTSSDLTGISPHLAGKSTICTPAGSSSQHGIMGRTVFPSFTTPDSTQSRASSTVRSSSPHVLTTPNMGKTSLPHFTPRKTN